MSPLYTLVSTQKGAEAPSDSTMVTLRGPSAKRFWDGLERFDEQLEELGVGDKAKSV